MGKIEASRTNYFWANHRPKTIKKWFGEFETIDEGIRVPKEIEIDSERQVKIYASHGNRILINSLSEKAALLYLWIIYAIEPTKDFVYINKERYMQEKRIKSPKTVRAAINELIDKEVLLPYLYTPLPKQKFERKEDIKERLKQDELAKSKERSTYWINIDLLFCGSRINALKKKINPK